MANTKAAKRNIRRYERQLTRGRMRDFRTTGSINDAIFGSLSGFLGRRAGRLSRSDARTLARMVELQGGLRRAGRGVQRRQSDTVDRYGDALADSSRLAFEGAAQSNREATRVLGAHKTASEMQAATGRGLLGIAQAGAEQARAGADYATSQVLQARTKADVTQIAQMRHEVALTELQGQMQEEAANADFERQKKLLEFQANLAAGKLGDDWGGAESAASTLSSASVVIRRVLRENPDAEAEQAIQALTADGLLDPEDAANPAVRRLFFNIKNRNLYVSTEEGATRQGEATAVLDAMMSTWPFADTPAKKAALMKYILQHLQTGYAQARLGGGSGQEAGLTSQSGGAGGVPIAVTAPGLGLGI